MQKNEIGEKSGALFLQADGARQTRRHVRLHRPFPSGKPDFNTSCFRPENIVSLPVAKGRTFRGPPLIPAVQRRHSGTRSNGFRKKALLRVPKALPGILKVRIRGKNPSNGGRATARGGHAAIAFINKKPLPERCRRLNMLNPNHAATLRPSLEGKQVFPS